MGEKQTGAPLRVGFDSSLKIRFVGAKVSSDAGLPDVLNFDVLCRLPGAWVERVHRHARPGQIVLDMDSSGSPTYGKQEGAAHDLVAV